MYLFNGDFIDRGLYGFEVILTLFAYKWLYPKSFYLTRGNHEHINVAKNYGFEKEVNTKYSEIMFEYFAETFETLPLANLINEKILVVHGGLSNRDITLDDIKNIYRFKGYVPANSLMEYLLWSDPRKKHGCDIGKRGGIGIGFGPDITENFLKRNNLDLLIRSHEAKKEGYEIEHNGKCITIFSAPNYCGIYKNKGAMINITSDLKLTFKTFDAVTYPKQHEY
ncbi:serine/threonine-protein phosphatase 5 [Rhizophagus clarus]|nr:serine/threonine-protein phosphatase 5 [Rhizophagus clarus]